MPSLAHQHSPTKVHIGTGWKTPGHLSQTPIKSRIPAARWSHPGIDAAAELMTCHALSYFDIASVKIKTFHNATRLADHPPVSAYEFSYSIAFPVVCMIVRGQVGVSELEFSTLNDPDISRISTAITLINNPHLTQISDGKRWAQVLIVMRDG